MPSGCAGYAPFQAVSCRLEEVLAGGGVRVVTTKTDGGCGANLADARGGFQSLQPYRISWTTELAGQPTGSYQTVITATDFHGNQGSRTVTGCAN